MAAATLNGFCCGSNDPPPPVIRRRPPVKRPIIPKPNPIQSSTQQNLAIARRLYRLTAAGRIPEALSLFETAAEPDTFLYNLIIRGFTNAGFLDEALAFYYRMLGAGISPDRFTFPFLIKSCAGLPSLDDGLRAHGRLMKSGVDSDLFVCNSLISFYSKLGFVDSAVKVFDEMPERDSVSWNSMIDGYASNGEARRSLHCFRTMLEASGNRPDRYGVMGALSACSLEMRWMQGKSIHCYIVRQGLEEDIKIRTSLIDTYCKCGNMLYAERLFDRTTHRSVVTWNVLIGGHTINARPNDAFALAERMPDHGTDPDAVTMVNLLLACEQTRSVNLTRAIHCVVTRRGLLPHTALENSLVDTYGKCGKPNTSEILFRRLPEARLVQWNTMIAAYLYNGRCSEAAELFVELLEGPLQPDAFTVSSAVAAYADIASLMYGKQIQGYALKSEFGKNTYVMNSIIDMYARCGDLSAARSVFDAMHLKNVVSWNTMIMGYGIHGHARTAVELFSDMKRNGLDPDESTFVSVLTACSVGGLVEEGQMHFDSMKRDYGFDPRIEHYGCTVDLLGRGGDLRKAVEYIQKIPLEPTARIWGSLLRASRNSGNIEVAEFAAEKILALEHDNTGCYVILSTMYADAGRWEDVDRVRSFMKEEGLRRSRPTSLVELSSKTFSFINGDESQEECSTINQVCDILSRKIGEVVEDPIGAVGKRGNLSRRHSVRLAVGFALISSTVGEPVLVKKNVRVCDRCHRALKLISRYSRREIVVGDSRIYHHFSNGVCCCGDYW